MRPLDVNGTIELDELDRLANEAFPASSCARTCCDACGARLASLPS